MAAVTRCHQASVRWSHSGSTPLPRLTTPNGIRVSRTQSPCLLSRPSIATKLQRPGDTRRFSSAGAVQSREQREPSSNSKAPDPLWNRVAAKGQEQRTGQLWSRLDHIERQDSDPEEKSRMIARCKADLETEAAEVRFRECERRLSSVPPSEVHKNKADGIRMLGDCHTAAQELLDAKLRSTRLTVYAPLREVSIPCRLGRITSLLIDRVLLNIWKIVTSLSL